MDYQVQLSPKAERQLRRLTPELQLRIAERIDDLGGEPRPSGCQKLQGEAGLWRIRIGDYRVIYRLLDRAKTVQILLVGHRREVYR